MGGRIIKSSTLVINVKNLNRLIDKLIMGQTVDVTHLTESERCALVYRVRKLTHKPLKQWVKVDGNKVRIYLRLKT